MKASTVYTLIIIVVVIVMIPFTVLRSWVYDKTSELRTTFAMNDELRAQCRDKGGTLVYTRQPLYVCVKTIPLEESK